MINLRLQQSQFAELWHGVERATGNHKDTRRYYLSAVLQSVPIIPYTEQSAYEHARRTWRLLALVMTAALARWEEFSLHVHAGLEQELEPCDLKEVLLQTAIYAGIPAASNAFRLASEEIEKLKQR